jgi:hypothetical protein
MAVKSSIKTLPGDLKKAVDRYLREDRATQRHILGVINAELDRRGAGPVSRSALSRYARQMASQGLRIRQTREIAAAWVGELGEMPEGDIGRLLTEMVRTLAFDTASAITDSDAPAPPAALMALSRAVRDLEHAASLSDRRLREIREDLAQVAAERAVAAAGEAATEAGFALSPAALKRIREQIYGIVE